MQASVSGRSRRTTAKKILTIDELLVFLNWLSSQINDNMNIEQVREYTLSLNGVTEDQPFGDDLITFRLEGKIFLCLNLGETSLPLEQEALE